MRKLIIAILAAGAVLAAGCAGDGGGDGASRPPGDGALGSVRAYLLGQTWGLGATSEQLAEQAAEYRRLEASGASAALLRDVVADMRKAWREAHPLYQRMKAIAAGVPRFARFDRVLEARDGLLPRTRAAIFGDAPPDADRLLALTRELAARARELNAAARGWEPEQDEVFAALAAGAPVAARRLADGRPGDAEDVLIGMVALHDGVRPAIAAVSRRRDERIARELRALRALSHRLLRRRRSGAQAAARRVASAGAEAGERLEALAERISRTAARVG